MSGANLVEKERPSARGSDPSSSRTPAEALSQRELEVLALIAQGLSGNEVAERLFVAPRTVGYHQNNAYRKLCVKSAIQAVAAAMRQGLLPCYCQEWKGEKR